MAIKSITGRWILNTLTVIVLILIAVGSAGILLTKNYYYDSTLRILNSQASIVNNLIKRIADDNVKNYNEEIRNIVLSYSQKDKIELTALDYEGNSVVTSGGFEPVSLENITDFKEAMANEGSTASFIGKLENGERVMSVCTLLPVLDREIVAIRLMVSMSQVDRVIWNIAIIFIIIGIVILSLIIMSGLFFVNSIVRPIRQIGAVTKKIASGEFDSRIVPRSSDEIGELCVMINSMANELSKTEQIKNEFISSVSHELRTPLTAIKGWGETLITSRFEDKMLIKKGMKVIIAETERLSIMVEELLDFSRIQNGRFTINRDKMDILAELGDAVLIYEEKARNDGKQIIYNEPQMLPIIYGDRNRLRQVFINIIDNAIKYSDSGDVITIHAFEKEGAVIITIKDTGVGIKEEDLPHVTEKFYKADQTRRGSGIGLAVANEIVTMHGGVMKVDSTYGKGTKVTIVLPTEETKTKGENNK